ncbi:sarcosine oxidase subunit delta [Aureimonas sp. SA4125]|uniref:sarcosine oxidase subunit delta n=1 Tax=Aureimonas sp. SA4125 TaxID=2826993 RepID=UPI001CC4F624|nr:sarcosine oxidase subunit delta [Aureimonas sp. SA4125]BDA83313.1 sarcosine oxidase subunit delta [Aureimonas sp. SA4125]
MRIDCPYCGSRDLREFSFLGDADAAAGGWEADVSPESEADRVYLRSNPAGRHTGLWYHEAGCRSWLLVERDTVSHAVHSVQLAGAEAGREGGR